MTSPSDGSLIHPDRFPRRHLGPDEAEITAMLKTLQVGSLAELIDQAVPKAIRLNRSLDLRPGKGEHELLGELRALSEKNQLWKSFLGMGYSDTITPAVILRNILESPGWYTQYTPYQAEIAQGRLEALLNFQTMIADLTGMELANASLLDEGTAAAEAMTMLRGLHGKGEGDVFFVSERCHAQTVAVVRTRAEPLGIEVVVGDHATLDFAGRKFFGALLQYPAQDGELPGYGPFVEKAHAAGLLVVVATDLLALTLLSPPGEWGADVVIGNSQRFGVPLGYGGPHAAFFATRAQYTRSLPGRLIGVSQDARGRPALRMALQTREQHIRREKATSNICTAQVLLAVVAGMYGVYHGPGGLLAIASYVHGLTAALAAGLRKQGLPPKHAHFFDTLRIETTPEKAREIHDRATARRINLRRIDERTIGVSLDETSTTADVAELLQVLGGKAEAPGTCPDALPPAQLRKSPYLTHPVFNSHHSETQMLRYVRGLEQKDLSLTHSMTPLGSCTMKLNATSEMLPISWPAWNRLHPFVPREQAAGYAELFRQLEGALAEVTGFAGVSLQPNAGSQGEYTGLLVIRAYHRSRGQGHRDVCLIPQSAHGTNPASAVLAGAKVVVVKTDENGNVDLADLRAKATQHREKLQALMVTYPSTHGVFEEEIREICAIVHEHGGQVYMDGANMNAQVGLCRPGDFGADVCHLNLHKTFCIPHGGGGPGVGPIAVAKHLTPFLPGHPVVRTGGEHGVGAVASAPWGSASILVIPWMYVKLMGAEGLAQATRVAILNANYVAARLAPSYPVLYQGARGRVAHECILDMRNLKKSAGIEVEDLAKRLMDYGFHAPTVSFPVPSTMMIEPTESESKGELDRFCDAMIAIREEIAEIEAGKQPKDDNLLVNAPHPADVVTADAWTHPYSRERAAFPKPWVKAHKFWPPVARLNNVLGDRKLVCSCPPIEAYEE